MAASASVWIVTRRQELARRWRRLCEREGWPCAEADGPARLGGSGRRSGPCVVLLDWDLASARPAEVVAGVRARLPEATVVLLTDDDALYASELARAIGSGVSAVLAASAADRELAARLGAQLEAAGAGGPGLLSAADGSFVVDRPRRTAWALEGPRRRRVEALTAKEFDLLCALLERPTTALPRSALLAAVWGERAGAVNPETLDRHVGSLRRKLGRAGKRIKTVHGTGYAFE